LKINLEKEEKIVFSANNLIGKLTGERIRWGISSENFKTVLQELPFRTVIAAGFLTFLGKEGETTRNAKLEKWSEVLNLTPKVEILRLMSTESQNLNFKNEGISGDNLSLENIISIKNSQQLSFIIDPNLNCFTWLQGFLTKADTV